MESFAGVATPFSLGRLEPGERVKAEYATLLEQHGFEGISRGNLVATYARSVFEDPVAKP